MLFRIFFFIFISELGLKLLCYSVFDFCMGVMLASMNDLSSILFLQYSRRNSILGGNDK